MAPITSHIERLRDKPHHIRKRIAFWSSFTVTAIIAIFWLASFSIGGGSGATAVIGTSRKAQSPTQSLVAGAGILFDDIKHLIFGSRKVEYNEIQVSPGK